MIIPVKLFIAVGVACTVLLRADASVSTQQTSTTDLPQGATITVDGRTLAGALSFPQQRGQRIFLPLSSIARALGDTVSVDLAGRTIEVRRQTGVIADFSAESNQVRENGTVILIVPNSGNIPFPPNADELMLPIEIVSALLDASVLVDTSARVIRIARGRGEPETVRPGAKRRPWEIIQADYDYTSNLYSSASNHNLTLRLGGRLGDGRLNLLTNSSGGTGSRFGLLRNGLLTYERPNEQRFVAGDFGTGTDLLFMSSAVRGASAQVPFHGVRLTAFGGRAISGTLPIPSEFALSQSEFLPELQSRQYRLRYDTNVFGAYATFGPSAKSGQSQGFRKLLVSSGLLHFNGPNSKGQMSASSLRFNSRRSHVQADFGIGSFSGVQQGEQQVSGMGLATDVSGSFDVGANLTLQGRLAHISQNFLGPQSGLHIPISLMAGGATWRPREWLSASFTGSVAKRPDSAAAPSGATEASRFGKRDRFFSTSFTVSPRNAFPVVTFAHSESHTAQLNRASYTFLNAIKDFNRWRLFANATRNKINGPASLDTQIGADLRINESNTVQVSQSFGNRGSLGGSLDWFTPALFTKRISFGAGLAYNRYGDSPLRTTERLSATVRLPRASTLQLTYVHSGQTGPQLLLSLRGSLLRRGSRAELLSSSPIGEMSSYGAFYGRVYQDVNLNGRFDSGVDKPQPEVKVRVDGNRYVESDANGQFRIDSVKTGDHTVYLDLLSVRADLTMLDGAQQAVALVPGRDSIIDFRLVRTGRITGAVWLDVNGNSKLDDGEEPLSDIRVVTGSGRDTLTDASGVFVIGDLPPGEHVVLVDEKTLPEKTKSFTGSLSVKVLAGSETGAIDFPVRAIPPEIKRFP